ncbi:MAG: AMP-binding protein [Leptospiraceae bacterium]|nr:AMP-binding protein [Leptospiraceae bacterium]
MLENEPRYFYDMVAGTARRFPDRESFRRRMPNGSFVGRTYSEMLGMIDGLVAGLVHIGLNIGDRVTFLCDISQNWLITDCGIVSAGGVSVPRGTDVTREDIIYIVSHSESRFAFVQREKDRKRLEELRSNFPTLERIFVIEQDDGSLATGADTLGALIAEGQALLQQKPGLSEERRLQTDPDALATLIYTSGTTGAPKGVMLNQSGWIAGIRRVLKRVGFQESDRVVSLLPPWHAFERAVEYAIASLGINFLVSDINYLKEDLADFKPTIFPSVPRIWETVYNGILAKIKKESPGKQKVFFFFLKIGTVWSNHRATLSGYDTQIQRQPLLLNFIRRCWALNVLCWLLPLKLLSGAIFGKIHKAVGGHLRTSISGGSALPAVVDRFLQAIGIPVVEGYGMTETSAIISIRHLTRPTPGTVGTPIDGYQIKLKDEQGNIVKGIGEKGTLWVKSDQILMGYYKRPELNDIVFDSDGFFDTGDIMKLTWRGELMFAGRAKDTIALGGGENIEPVPIEDKLLESAYIDQIMVVGDDQKTLGALIVPNFELVMSRFRDISSDYATWNDNRELRQLFRTEITRLINRQNGFKSFETIPGNCFYLVPRNFDRDTEMTRTLKMKRPVIKTNFEKNIKNMYH